MATELPESTPGLDALATSPMSVGRLSPMILAAGRAVRLRPLTERRPKAVVPFLNRPLLDYSLDWLRRHGFERVTINLHHGGDSIVATHGERAFDMQIQYSDEPVLLGSGGGPRAALAMLGDPVLLVNGDLVTNLSLSVLAAHHVASDASVTLALNAGPIGRRYPQCRATADGRLAAFPDEESAEPAPVSGVFAGVHIVARSVLESVPEGAVCGIVDPLYRLIREAGIPIHALSVPGAWYEVGDPRLYIDHQLAALRRGDLPLAVLGSRCFAAGGYVGAYTHLDAVRLVPPYLLGAGARARRGSYLEGVVVGERTCIESGCWLQEVVTWRDAWIGAGCDLRRVIVMEGVRVPPCTCARGLVFTPAGPHRFEPEPAPIVAGEESQ